EGFTNGSRHSISDDDEEYLPIAELLAEALYVNTSLEELCLYENHIESRGAKALAKALHKNNILTTLKIAVNLIDFE
ncbi:8267_t:CDS:2, partial [Cetraspora pellucida]